MTLYFPGFDETAKQFGSRFIEGSCYRISHCNVTPSSPNYTGIAHRYQLKLNQNSCVIPVAAFEPTFVPSYTPLDQLKSLHKSITYVNIIAVVIDAGDPYWYSKVGERRHKLRREVKIMDESCQPLWLSFYGDEAGKISDSVLNEGIVSISEVRVWRWGFDRFNLHMWFDKSRITVEPATARAKELRDWWRNERQNERKRLMISHDSVDPLKSSVRSQALPTDTSSFASVEENLIDSKGKFHKNEEYNWISGVITIVKRDNFIYTACPVQLCRKKVTEVNRATTSRDSCSSEGYYCPSCNMTYNRFNYGYALKVFIKDYSSGRWASIFNVEAEKLLKRMPEEIISLREELSGFCFELIMNRPVFKEYVFRIKSVVRTFFEEKRIDHIVDCVEERRPCSLAAGLIKEINYLESS